MSDLATWLLEHIADDERIAREGFSNQADPEHGWGTEDVTMANPEGMRPAVTVKRVVTPHVGIIHEEVQRAHIVRWHPGRVLAECDAKRRMVAEAKYWYDKVNNQEDYPALSDRFDVAFGMLRLLALPYADRPGYRAEWRP